MIRMFFRKVSSLVLSNKLDKKLTTMNWNSQDDKWMRCKRELKLTHKLTETPKLSGSNLSNTLYWYIM